MYKWIYTYTCICIDASSKQCSIYDIYKCSSMFSFRVYVYNYNVMMNFQQMKNYVGIIEKPGMDP